ncbi:GATOR2 complex protein WDR24 [Pleurotus pulmonarius]
MSAGTTNPVQRGRKLSIFTTTLPVVEFYSDARNHGYQGPLRTVRLPRVTSSGGGAIARNEDGTHCAVAGMDSLRVVSLSSPSNLPTPDHKHAVGRGGHRIDSSRNFWDGGGLTSASTDVSWGFGSYENKIFTSARNGEFIMWDASRSGSGKYSIERRSKDHTRSIHKLAVSRFSYYCITGSADGTVKLWDIRDLSKPASFVRHPTSVRTLAFSPFESHPYQAVTGLDNGSIYRWDLKMGQRGQLDRLLVAHSAAVTSLDWCSTSSNHSPGDMAAGGLGWIVSGGLDHCVKVWDLSSSSHIQHKPTYTLHPSFPVRRVMWRPSYPCEVAVVSNAEFGSGSNPDMATPEAGSGTSSPDSRDRSSLRTKQYAGDPIEIWDVRRGWIAKWSVNGSASEGGVTDIAFGDSHALWAQHSSGTFAQLDLRHCTKPLDSIPRVAVSWAPSGALALVSDVKPRREVPYDDISPSKLVLAEERRIHIKALGDSTYTPKSQSTGVFADASLMEDVDTFAALARGYVLEGHERRVLCDINANVAFQANREVAAQTWMLLGLSLVDLVDESRPEGVSTDELSSHHLSQSASAPAALTLHSVTSPMDRFHRPETGSLRVSPNRPSTPNKERSTSAVGRSNSTSTSRRVTPTSSNASSPHLLPNALPPITPRNQSFSKRRSASGLGVQQGSSLRRQSMSANGALMASPSSSLRHVGEGALDDSDSESESDDHHAGPASSDEEPTHLPALPPLISPAISSSRVPVHPSPLSQIASRQRWTEDEDDADFSEEGSPSPRSTDSESESSDSPRRVTSMPRLRRASARMKSRSRSSTVASLAAPVFSHTLLKQDSHSSIRTVTAGEVSFRESGTAVQIAVDTGALEQRGATASYVESILPIDEPYDPDKWTDRGPDLVAADEQRYRDIAWEALRQAVETFADQGDVQMCAMMALIAPKELGIRPKRMIRFVDSYLDLLTRLSLFSSCAYIRKFVEAEEIRNHSKLETTIYTFCGKCRKPLVVSAGNPAFGELVKGGFAYCKNCKSACVTCAICRLPVRSLFFQCAVCCHGGHQACYRKFYSERPMDQINHLRHDTAYATDARGRPKPANGRGTPQPSPTPKSTPDENADKAGVFAHPCAAGCGHLCWIARNGIQET